MEKYCFQQANNAFLTKNQKALTANLDELNIFLAIVDHNTVEMNITHP